MFAISPTDNEWFKFLKDRDFNSFVNFWTPTPWNVKQLKSGDRWYFMLKSPIRQIGGFGEFIEYKNLTAFEAWRIYGHKNGAIDLKEFIDRIQLYIDKNSDKFGGKFIDINDYKIGCIILKNCQFFDEIDFINPEDYGITFGQQIVKFKYYNIYDPLEIGKIAYSNNFNLLYESREVYKRETNQRKGQGKFKGQILKAYKNKCCISEELCPELLEAGHIQKYINSQSNHIQNGILLRVDLHRLFDNDLLFIDKEYIIHISSLITNKLYTQYNGCKISLPDDPNEFPSIDSLEVRRSDFRK